MCLSAPRRFQVAHGALNFCVPKPQLHRTQINAVGKRIGREGGPKLVQPIPVLIEAATSRYSLDAISKIHLRFATGSGEQWWASFVGLGHTALKNLNQRVRNRNLAFLVPLWRPFPGRELVLHSHGACFQVHIGPEGKAYFLLTLAGHQGEVEPDILRLVARAEKRVQLLWLVSPVPLRCSAGGPPCESGR